MRDPSPRTPLHASVKLDPDRRPQSLRVRLRHPDGTPIGRVTVNGRPWNAFDPSREWVEIKAVDTSHYDIVAFY